MNQIKAWDLGLFRIKKFPNGNAESTSPRSSGGRGGPGLWGVGQSPKVLAGGPTLIEGTFQRHIGGRTDEGGLGFAVKDLVQERDAYKAPPYSELNASEDFPDSATQVCPIYSVEIRLARQPLC